MAKFNRMLTSWFAPPPGAEPSRKPRVAMKTEIQPLTPSVDERTAMAALEIMENHSFQRVVSRLKQEAFDEFASSAEGDAGAHSRDKAHMKISVIEEIEASIHVMSDSMKFHKRKVDGEPLT